MITPTLHAGSGEGDKVFYRDYERTEVTFEFPHSGNATLKQVLIFAGLSKATAYKHGIVPEYDDDGQLIDTGKVPPFPWSRMPHSLVRNRKGKKLFLAEEIRAWRQAVRDRSREIDAIAINNSNALVERGEI